MRDFAKKFYMSKAWKKLRTYIYEDVDHKLCRRCGAPGKIVHHKVWLTPDNIDDPYISLNPDMLETLCEECHCAEHNGRVPIGENLAFNGDGDITYTDAALLNGTVTNTDEQELVAQGLKFDEHGDLTEWSG